VSRAFDGLGALARLHALGRGHARTRTLARACALGVGRTRSRSGALTRPRALTSLAHSQVLARPRVSAYHAGA